MTPPSRRRYRSLTAAGLALLLSLSATLQAAETPAVFEVTTDVINPDPGAFTATTGPLHILVDFNFEPMVWRNNRFLAARDAVGRFYGRPNELDWFDSYAPGYWDGSDIRVLRVENGKMVQKFEGKVAKLENSQWTTFGSGNLIPRHQTSAQFAFEDWNKRGQQWWLCVVAVDEQGRQSAPSNAVAVADPDIPNEDRVKPEDVFTVPAPRLDENAEGAPPAAPAAFRASVDESTGVVSVSWQPASGNIAGYRILRSFTNPAAHKGVFLVLGPENGGDKFQVKKGDLIFLTRQRLSFNKDEFSPRIWGTPGANPPDFAPKFTPPGDWRSQPHPFELVRHPGRLPAGVADAGETCMKISATEEGLVSVRKYNHADTTQNWYRVLDPAKTYVVEFLARQEGLAGGTVQFHLTGPLANEFTPIDFDVTGEWKKFQAEFTVPRLLTEPGTVGEMGLQFNGPGAVWLDNFRVYEKSEGLVRHNPVDRAAFKESGMASMRTHDLIKTQGYTIESLLGHPALGLMTGSEVYTRANLAGLLKEYAEMGIYPWLQIEFTLSEPEWLALVEYLAAPWDPAKDTPASKPWAYRRVQHGHPEPYTKTFPRILLEFSNENWNQIMPFHLSGIEMPDAATGKLYTSGEVYGLLQEYTIQVMKRSPWWTPEVDQKCEFVIGGWSITNFGYEAARHSPSSKHNLVADYNGGWDAGEGPGSVNDLDSALLKTLIFGPQHSLPNAIRLRELRDAFAAETGIRTELGTYEAGPGYNLDGLNGVRMTPEMVEFESRVMKSLAAGASTLDCFLIQAAQGAQLQNFFTFSRNRHYWTSHAELRNGGQAYPSWMALSLYNNHAQGDILAVLTESVPTREAPAVGNRAALPDAPEVGVFATRKNDRLAVIAISRKLDGFTPVTIRLPISGARKVTLHTLTGDPRANNLDSEVIRPASRELPASVAAREFVLDESRGAPGGLPPGSVFLYIFDGAAFASDAPSAKITAPPGAVTEMPLRFEALFTEPPQAFTADNVALSGQAEPQGVTVTEAPGSFGRKYTISVNSVLNEGPATVTLRNLVTAKGAPIPEVSASATVKFPEGTAQKIAAWNFAALQTEQDRDWKGSPIPPSSSMPVIGPSELTASEPDLLGDNIHYNNDGAGVWRGAGQMAATPQIYSFRIEPLPGRTLEISKVECGFWSGVPDGSPEELQATLEVYSDGRLLASVPFTADRPLNNQGNLTPGSGIRATADLSRIPALQTLSRPAEFQIVLSGLEGQGGIFGIGKLGKEEDDLIVFGRVKK